MRPCLSTLIVVGSIFLFLQKPIATPHELVQPCEKKSDPLNSSCHFFSSSMDECVSCKKIIPFLFAFELRYLNIFSLFADAFILLTLFDKKQ